MEGTRHGIPERGRRGRSHPESLPGPRELRVGARRGRAHRATESVRSSLVRSGFPQPMGAGGRRPPWIPNRGLRAAPVRSVSKLAGLKAVPFDEGITAARTVRPFDENRRRTTMPRRAASAARRFAVAEEAATWTSPGRPVEQAERNGPVQQEPRHSGNPFRDGSIPRRLLPGASPCCVSRASIPLGVSRTVSGRS